MAGFGEHHDDFRDAGVRLVALTAEDEDGARKMKQEEELSFPVLHGLDVDSDAARFGLYVARGDRTFVQPAQLILDPEGRVRFASYSNGRAGRLTAEDALAEIPN